MRRVMLGLGLAMAILVTGCCRMVGYCPMMKSCPMAGKGNVGKVRHVVLFKFKDGATPEQVKAIEAAFRELPSKISGIRAFEWGTDVSPEGLAQGFTHCFFLTFDDAKARDAYLPSPAHKAFGEQLKPILDKVLVVDYVAAK